MADALPESTLAALDDPFAQLSGPLASSTRLDFRVVESARLTPHMQRLRLTAPELDGFEYLPGQDVMLLVAAEGSRPVRRRYTIRELDARARLLTLDIVLHGDGPGERWVRSARPGDRIEGIGPRGKITTSPAADWHLFVGDESALPAMFVMTEALPGRQPGYPGPGDPRGGRRAGAVLGGDHPHLLAAPPRRSGRRPGRARGRGGRGRTAARARPGLSLRRGEGRVPAAGHLRRARAGPGPDVTEGVLGPRPGQRQSRRARPGRLAALRARPGRLAALRARPGRLMALRSRPPAGQAGPDGTGQATPVAARISGGRGSAS